MFTHSLTIRSFDYTAACVPAAGVGSSPLALLQSTLFIGLTWLRLQSLMSFLMQIIQDFIGLPHLRLPGTGRSQTVFMQVGACGTCPNQWRRWAHSRSVMSTIPSFASNSEEGTLSRALVLQIHRIIDRSLHWSLCSTETVGPQVSLPCSIAEQTQEENNFPRVFRETSFEVKIGRGFLNLPNMKCYEEKKSNRCWTSGN